MAVMAISGILEIVQLDPVQPGSNTTTIGVCVPQILPVVEAAPVHPSSNQRTITICKPSDIALIEVPALAGFNAGFN